jgi:DNA-binding transcriptional LysR family regulator
MLDVTRLRVLDAVARHGSVTAAAKELHYSQPSVSHHLLGSRPRPTRNAATVGRGIRLTQAGSYWPTGRPRSSGGSVPPTLNCLLTWG